MHAFAHVHALNALAETCALCVAQVGVVHHTMHPEAAINEAVGLLLEMATKHGRLAYDAILAGK